MSYEGHWLLQELFLSFVSFLFQYLCEDNREVLIIQIVRIMSFCIASTFYVTGGLGGCICIFIILLLSVIPLLMKVLNYIFLLSMSNITM